MYLAWIYLFMNIIGLWMMGFDKRRAKKRGPRISEKSLWLWALLGGALGMTVGMFQFRHKTKHLQFKLGLPFLAILQSFFLYFFY